MAARLGVREAFSFARRFTGHPTGRKLPSAFDEKRVPEYNMQVWGRFIRKTTALISKGRRSQLNCNYFGVPPRRRQNCEDGHWPRHDVYIPASLDGQTRHSLIRRMNRLQNRLDIRHADPGTGQTRTVLTSQSDKYVDLEQPTTLPTSTTARALFTPRKERLQALYHYDMNGKLIRQITTATGKWVIFWAGRKTRSAVLHLTEVSPLQRHLYSIGLTVRTRRN
jgi:dipeptidyl-peptidase-4